MRRDEIVQLAVGILLIAALSTALSHADEVTEVAPALAAIEALTAWDGDVAFEAKARISMGAGPSRPVDGSYHLVRRDRQTWREEIQLPNYRREIVARDGMSWVEQQGEYQPVRVFDLDELLDFTSRHRDAAAGTLRRDRLGKGKHGLHCFDILCDTRTRELCIEPQDGLLRSETYALRIRNYAGNTKIRYDDFVPFGAGLFPRQLTMERNGKPVVTLAIEELRLLEPASVPSESFAPNAGEKRRVNCVRTRPTWVFDRTIPTGPSASSHGLIVARVLVDTHGSVREIDVLRGSLTKDLVPLRWQPGTCDGMPVDSLARYELHPREPLFGSQSP